MAVAAITTLADEDGKDPESKAVPWTAAWKNSNLCQLDEWAKREDTTRSIAGSSVDGTSLLSGRGGATRTAA